jgi:L-lactate dehydrogenase complex protein LldG
MVEVTVVNVAESLFGRIREALRIAAPRPHGGAGLEGVGAVRRGGAPDYRGFLPRTGSGPEDWMEQFRQNAVELRADFVVVEDAAAAGKHLAGLRDAEGWHRVATHAGELTGALVGALGLEVLRVEARHSAVELEVCEAGISECDLLVAQTGSVVVSARSAGGRALSCLPPHHVVLARRSQLVAGLPEAFECLQAKYGSGYPSMISFITGPSRTGDIERILVLGAHGPKKLTILCW